MFTSRLKIAAVLVFVLAALASWTASRSTPPAPPSELADLLAHVSIAPAHPAPGYDRRCGGSHGCVFGPDKSDDHAGLDGHNGCDGFNDLARTMMTHLVPANGCVVTSGEWVDPYTGQVTRFVRDQAPTPTIEHIVALRTAWDRGASAWTQQRRVDFANDHQLNLLLVAGSINASKGDRSPSQWLPPLASARCPFVTRYLQVSLRWNLPITPADHDAIASLAPACSSPPEWTSWPKPQDGS